MMDIIVKNEKIKLNMRRKEQKKIEVTNKKNNIEKTDMIEVWEDVVSLKELLLSLAICIFMSFAGYYFAPDKEPLPLLLGLLGAILGFIICSIMIKPKRVFIQESEE